VLVDGLRLECACILSGRRRTAPGLVNVVELMARCQYGAVRPAQGLEGRGRDGDGLQTAGRPALAEELKAAVDSVADALGVGDKPIRRARSG